MIQIQEISSNETFEVRHPVLRSGKPITSCHFDGDNLSTTKHFGLFVNKKIVGVVSVYKNINTIFIVANQHQIRGMAVLEEHRKKGYGELLMAYSEKHITNQKGTLIWFNARENAVPFYEKLGYNKVGNPFNIADIGLHYIMKKEIGESAYE